ncbi:helix-turn-helix domain-containing protein [Nocardia sp. NPDC051570]|uniref:helix-turn-helix domain-containing protein n=1 Tax=Nocardia sp. NPDC051570 TaxID=3364324 RepID=UPI0037A2A504
MEQWEFGRRIQQAREAAGLSKRAAAKRAGISDSRWRQLELGFETVRGQAYSVKTTPETVAHIAKAVHLDVHELLEIAGFDPEAADISDGISLEWIDVAGLPEADVEKVRAFVQFLKSQQ